jgi:hypothetical protein
MEEMCFHYSFHEKELKTLEITYEANRRKLFKVDKVQTSWLTAPQDIKTAQW